MGFSTPTCVECSILSSLSAETVNVQASVDAKGRKEQEQCLCSTLPASTLGGTPDQLSDTQQVT